MTAKFSTLNSIVQCDYNAIFGYGAMSTATLAKHNSAFGGSALAAGGISDNAAFGFRALAFLGETGNQIRNTAIGTRAMEFMIDGSQCIDVFNSSAIGYQAYISGSNQVQLGNSFTTPYAYNALQLRSDKRDKINIRDTELGIEFILGLHPVQANLNPRERYVITEEYQDGFTIDDQGNEHPIINSRYAGFDDEGYKAGTKAGGRNHNWFIAQEVDELCQSLQIDFAGLHNHNRNGGSDVFSLGYEEFIPPIVKAVQQCWERIDDIESRLRKLERKV
ncbi:tail fiber domain-containing protein [Yersinia intermedia]|nr:tail fiber domain-containing protein [Yersinia intermedia]